jgi:hypothetical protein
VTGADIIKLAREAAAKHGHTFRDVPQTETIEFLEAFFLLASEAEREECAQACDELQQQWRPAGECADAIRARGQS